jgi:hypothetical protein
LLDHNTLSALSTSALINEQGLKAFMQSILSTESQEKILRLTKNPLSGDRMHACTKKLGSPTEGRRGVTSGESSVSTHGTSGRATMIGKAGQQRYRTA